MRTETHVGQRYRPGYWYEQRLWTRRIRAAASARKQAAALDFQATGSLISRAGKVWRLCGLGGTGMRLLRIDPTAAGEHLTFRDVDYCTIHRAIMHGWEVRMDKAPA